MPEVRKWRGHNEVGVASNPGLTPRAWRGPMQLVLSHGAEVGLQREKTALQQTECHHLAGHGGVVW